MSNEKVGLRQGSTGTAALSNPARSDVPRPGASTEARIKGSAKREAAEMQIVDYMMSRFPAGIGVVQKSLDKVTG